MSCTYLRIQGGSLSVQTPNAVPAVCQLSSASFANMSPSSTDEASLLQHTTEEISSAILPSLIYTSIILPGAFSLCHRTHDHAAKIRARRADASLTHAIRTTSGCSDFSIMAYAAQEPPAPRMEATNAAASSVSRILIHKLYKLIHVGR